MTIEMLYVRILPTMKQPDSEQFNYVLVRKDNYLTLTNTNNPDDKPFYIDFLARKMKYRASHAGLRRELLARAIGMKPKDNPTIIDATAGLGRDGYILATIGFHVTLLERSPLIYALLEDALQRARASSPDNACHRLTLINADAITWLPNNMQTIKPDVIYLDPMFPERKKSASVKKDMRILNDLLGHDNDIKELLSVSMACAGKRVVVKRPRLTANDKPDFSLSGNSTRFDVYLTKA